MMFVVIISISFLASMLTFFSGFGLGTLLLPAFTLFFPPQEAVALTALVHFMNNIFKFSLTFRNIDKRVLLLFGVPSLLAATAGAFLLKAIGNSNAFFQYEMANRTFSLVWIKVLIGGLMLIFALFEIIPFLKKLEFDQKYLSVGGILSGFFGGLSGHQGALRSAFLVKCGLSKEIFISTGIAIACLVDISRLIVYGISTGENNQDKIQIIILAVVAAFAGAFIGNRWLKKITLQTLQTIIAAMLIVIAGLLMSGII